MSVNMPFKSSIMKYISKKHLKLNMLFKSSIREYIAKKYLKGTGIEIGALHNPLKLSSNASVKYVDRMTVDELRKQYPELNLQRLVDIDVIDDGEKLEKFKDDSLNFIIANHFLEHAQNPVEAIKNFLRILKKDGIIYVAIPDKRYTFDRGRPITSFDHLLKDYLDGPQWSYEIHFEEWVRYVEKAQESEIAKRVKSLIDCNYSIHFHVWTQNELLELLFRLKSELMFNFEIELFLKHDHECIVILKKS